MNTRCWRYTVSSQAESIKYSTWGTPATVKLKGIDGGPTSGGTWFNSMIREEPYPGLNCSGMSGNGSFLRTVVKVLHGCRQLVP